MKLPRWKILSLKKKGDLNRRGPTAEEEVFTKEMGMK